MKPILKSAMLMGALGASVPATAVITILAGPNSFPDENVLFNSGSLIGTGPLVEGITNTSNHIVNFSDAGEDLTTPSGGQARVEAVDGDLTDLRLSFANPLLRFKTLIWNLNADDDGSVTFTVHRTGGPDVMDTFVVDEDGQNFFSFEATGESMIWVSLDATVDLDDVRQTRIGGIELVPEPASLAGMGLALAGWFGRRGVRQRVA